MGRKVIDLTGQRFGRLEVLKQTTSSWRGATWLVRCACGTEKKVRSTDLVYSGVQSCGCLKRELMSVAPGKAMRNETLSHYKYGAVTRGFAWELTEEDFDRLTAGDCHYCGVGPSNFKKGKNGGFAYNGIDRKDNTVGYIAGNAVSCCRLCNRLKGKLDYSVFADYLNRVTAYRAKSQLSSSL